MDNNPGVKEKKTTEILINNILVTQELLRTFYELGRSDEKFSQLTQEDINNFESEYVKKILKL